MPGDCDQVLTKFEFLMQKKNFSGGIEREHFSGGIEQEQCLETGLMVRGGIDQIIPTSEQAAASLFQSFCNNEMNSNPHKCRSLIHDN